MTKKTRKTFLASIVTAVYILATMTACSSNGVNSDNLSSDTVTTTHTDIQTPSPETTTTPVPETEQKNEAAEEEKKTETSVITSDTPAPETEQSVPETEQTTTSQTEAETPAPETTTTVQTTTPQTEAQVTTPATTVTTTPAPEWDESKVSGTKYVNTACYSRKKAVLGAETVKLYNVNDKVTVVAKTNTGYYKLDDGTFIHSDYLSDSKVVFTTTTVQTTTPKPQTEAPASSAVEQVDYKIYTKNAMTWYYHDVDCTEEAGYYDCVGTAYDAVEYHKDKGVYKIVTGTGRERYIKSSDVTLTDPVEAMYHYPFDFDAIRQRLIDEAVNEYGLVLDEDYNDINNSTWFPPTQVSPNTPAWILKRNIEGNEYVAGKVEANTEGHLQAGDYFNIVIETVDIDEVNEDREDKLDYSEGWLIYFLRGRQARN